MQRGLDVVDCGNVSGPANPGQLKIDGTYPQFGAGYRLESRSP